MRQRALGAFVFLKCLKQLVKREVFFGRNELAGNVEGLDPEIEVSGHKARLFHIAYVLAR